MEILFRLSKKCGNISIEGVRKAHAGANLKTGTVGIGVAIMPPTVKLPDDIKIEEKIEEVEEKQE